MADNTLNFDLDAPAVPTLTLDPTPAAVPQEEKPVAAPAPEAQVNLTPEDTFANAAAEAAACNKIIANITLHFKGLYYFFLYSFTGDSCDDSPFTRAKLMNMVERMVNT